MLPLNLPIPSKFTAKSISRSVLNIFFCSSFNTSSIIFIISFSPRSSGPCGLSSPSILKLTALPTLSKISEALESIIELKIVFMSMGKAALPMDIKTIFSSMIDSSASDILLKVGSAVNFRIDGLLRPQGPELLGEKDIMKIIDEVLNDEQKKIFNTEREIDFAVNFEGIGRFRGSIFHQNGMPGAVFRYIKGKVQTFEELNLPSKVLAGLGVEKRGMILVTGATGSGKSTTIASLIEYINQNLPSHIVTIEDPIEFMFEDKRSLIEQRELGIDTPSYLEALKHIMYQSPDVIFIGNIRDQETMTAYNS